MVDGPDVADLKEFTGKEEHRQTQLYEIISLKKQFHVVCMWINVVLYLFWRVIRIKCTDTPTGMQG